MIRKIKIPTKQLAITMFTSGMPNLWPAEPFQPTHENIKI